MVCGSLISNEIQGKRKMHEGRGNRIFRNVSFRAGEMARWVKHLLHSLNLVPGTQGKMGEEGWFCKAV